MLAISQGSPVLSRPGVVLRLNSLAVGELVADVFHAVESGAAKQEDVVHALSGRYVAADCQAAWAMLEKYGFFVDSAPAASSKVSLRVLVAPGKEVDFQERWAKSLASSSFNVNFVPFTPFKQHRSQAPDELDEALALIMDGDYTLVFAPAFLPGVFRALNGAFCSHEKAWTLCFPEAAWRQLATFEPFSTACYECLWSRTVGESSVDDVLYASARCGSLEEDAGMAFALFHACEVARGSPSTSKSSLLRINLVEGLARHVPRVRQPRCPTCGSGGRP